MATQLLQLLSVLCINTWMFVGHIYCFVSKFDIFPLISTSAIVNINGLTLIVESISHIMMSNTDKNNNASFEILNIPYH